MQLGPEDIGRYSLDAAGAAGHGRTDCARSNSIHSVLGEIGFVLVAALGSALAAHLVLALLHIA
ncbi:MAG: hypothetical protein ACREHF_13230 [Rhizomicrobium sp.]